VLDRRGEEKYKYGRGRVGRTERMERERRRDRCMEGGERAGRLVFQKKCKYS
jgi:hypothetical protein